MIDNIQFRPAGGFSGGIQIDTTMHDIPHSEELKRDVDKAYARLAKKYGWDENDGYRNIYGRKQSQRWKKKDTNDSNGKSKAKKRTVGKAKQGS